MRRCRGRGNGSGDASPAWFRAMGLMVAIAVWAPAPLHIPRRIQPSIFVALAGIGATAEKTTKWLLQKTY